MEAAEAREAADRAARVAAPAAAAAEGAGLHGARAHAAPPAAFAPPPLPSKPMPPPKPKGGSPVGAAPASPPLLQLPLALPTFDAFGDFASASSAPPPSPAVYTPSLRAAPPAPLSVDLFDPQPWVAPAAPPNLLDAPSPPPTPSTFDPYGIAGGTTPGPLNTMTPLTAALPRVPMMTPLPSPTPARAKLGEASKKSNDPFANLMDL